MANGNYVGRFGDTLRRLTALQAQQGAFAAPQQVGGADTASPFAATPPGALEGGPQPPAPTPPATPAPSGFGAGAPADVPTGVDESGAMGGETPTSWASLTKAMPKEHKKALADQIESHVGDLKGTYTAVAQQNGIAPKPHASRTHMALYLAEVALNAAANRGTSASGGEALAKGVLQTNARRDALAMSEQERQRQEAETMRREARDDSIRQEGYDRGDQAHVRDRGEKLEDDKRNHEQALELERLRVSAEKARAKGQNVKVIVADDGSYKLIDLDTKQTVPVEEDVEVTTPARGSRGKGTTSAKTTTKKKPVKALTKPNASGLDQDTIQRMISDRIKALADKDRGFRKKTPEEQSKIATDLVMKEVTAVEGAGNTGTSKTIDFNDLP